jgi:histidinol dehydrogenase
MRIYRHDSSSFETELRTLDRRAEASKEVLLSVATILSEVRCRGDAAVLDYVAKFGGPRLEPADMQVSALEFEEAEQATSDSVKEALRLAHDNVREFAKYGLRKNWQMVNRQGAFVGERFHPYQRVGIYVPGGNAPLVSTAIMTVTLAATAGVPEIVVSSPCGAEGRILPELLYALRLAGATEVYRIGGAQAIGAMAYGTESIGRVAKIFGPGNDYVVEAKRQVFGTVSIDLLPGPSEIMVIADHTADPVCIAADLTAQAEHGHGSIIFVTDDEMLVSKVQRQLDQQSLSSPRHRHISRVFQDGLFVVLVRSIDDAVEIANQFAPEHVSIVARTEEKLAAGIHTAGAIFLGHWSPVAAGDFVAGPSHELPTGGSGKSFSGLTVDEFQRRTSLVRFHKQSLQQSLSAIETLSAVEGLDGHGKSANARFLEP